MKKTILASLIAATSLMSVGAQAAKTGELSFKEEVLASCAITLSQVDASIKFLDEDSLTSEVKAAILITDTSGTGKSLHFSDPTSTSLNDATLGLVDELGEAYDTGDGTSNYFDDTVTSVDVYAVSGQNKADIGVQEHEVTSTVTLDCDAVEPPTEPTEPTS